MDRFSYQIFQSSIQSGVIESGDRILISISGGIDSMSLFCLLRTFQEKIKLELHLLHFHHGLRQESDEEEAFLRQLAEEKKVPITVVRTQSLSGKKGMQNKARDWRYQHMKQIAQQVNCSKIALGHHLNDLVETQLWRMSRGASLFSLSPMLENNPPFIRPLLRIKKNALKEYLLNVKQEWREDPSNQNNDYTRNMIRNQLVPVMRDCSGEQLEEKLLALYDDSLLLREAFAQMIPEEVYQAEKLDYSIVQAQSSLFAMELLHRFLLYHGQEEINRKNLIRIERLIRSNQGNWRVSLKNGQALCGKKKQIFFIPDDNPRHRK